MSNGVNLKKYYPRRDPWSHKGQFGYVLIVAGSNRYSGSPIFNAVSALRSGADLITIVGPKRAMDIAASFLPDIITEPLDDELGLKHVPKILDLAKNFHSLIIGGGLNRSKKTYQAIKEIIKNTDLPMVIDAEAIRAIAGEKEIVKNKNLLRSEPCFRQGRRLYSENKNPRFAQNLVCFANKNPRFAQNLVCFANKKVIITPHSEEFRILTGEKLKPEVDPVKSYETGILPKAKLFNGVEDRKEKVKRWADKLKTVILLKGHIDVISDGKKVALNKTGSSFMTKGGFGDTLSGICGALLARQVEPFEAAQVAAYINGRAGELACEKYGEGVLASDIFEFIPPVINQPR